MYKCDSYLLDTRALALESVFTGEYKSKITTTRGIYFSKLTPIKLLDKVCLHYFSSMQGRVQAANTLLKYPKKTPFLIAPNEFGVFPTASPKNSDCVWIFSHHFTLTEVAKRESIVTFMNGTSINVKASNYTISKQNQRLHTLLSISNFTARDKQIYLEGNW